MLKEELDVNCTEPVFLTDKKNCHVKLYTQSFASLLILDFMVCTIIKYFKMFS